MDDDDEEEQDENEDEKDDDEEDSSDEDFYEEDEDEEESNRVGEQAKRRRSDRLLSQGSSGSHQRPNTARPSGKVAKFKPSSKSQNRIKNLRLMQLKNRGSDHHVNEENLIKTAVGRVNADKVCVNLCFCFFLLISNLKSYFVFN